MNWTDDDERAAREAAEQLCRRLCGSDWHPPASHMRPDGKCGRCIHLATAIRTARQAGEASMRSRAVAVLQECREEGRTDLREVRDRLAALPLTGGQP